MMGTPVRECPEISPWKRNMGKQISTHFWETGLNIKAQRVLPSLRCSPRTCLHISSCLCPASSQIEMYTRISVRKLSVPSSVLSWGKFSPQGGLRRHNVELAQCQYIEQCVFWTSVFVELCYVLCERSAPFVPQHNLFDKRMHKVYWPTAWNM